MIVNIEHNGKLISVSAPYNAEFARAAKALNGNWTGSVWQFPDIVETRVRNLCLDYYGCDGLVENLVTLQINWVEGESAGAGPLLVHGRPIARAFGRDSGAKIQPAVVVLEGRFSSGGSVKNWRTVVEAGARVLVLHFPKAAAVALVAEQPNPRRVYSLYIEPAQASPSCPEDPHPVIVRFGQAVRAAREAIEMTQTELAQRSGIVQSYVGQIERAEANATLDVMARIADTLGVELHTLLSEEK